MSELKSKPMIIKQVGTTRSYNTPFVEQSRQLQHVFRQTDRRTNGQTDRLNSVNCWTLSLYPYRCATTNCATIAAGVSSKLYCLEASARQPVFAHAQRHFCIVWMNRRYVSRQLCFAKTAHNFSRLQTRTTNAFSKNNNNSSYKKYAYV